MFYDILRKKYFMLCVSSQFAFIAGWKMFPSDIKSNLAINYFNKIFYVLFCCSYFKETYMIERIS